ncbi:MAG: PKD-like domain-containing protein, partial [Rhodothermales bacterium]
MKKKLPCSSQTANVFDNRRYRYLIWNQAVKGLSLLALFLVGLSIQVYAQPPTPTAGTQPTVEFCFGDPSVTPSGAQTGVNVSVTLGANQKVVWILTAVPANSDWSIGDEFTTDNCGDANKLYDELRVGSTSQVIRVNSNAPQNTAGDDIVGTYSFDAKVVNCNNGNESGVLANAGSITVNPTPSAADITGAQCSNVNIGPQAIIPPTANASSWRYESLTLPVGLTGTAGNGSQVPGNYPFTNGNTGGRLQINNDRYENSTAGPLDAVYTITPISTDGCEGEEFTVTITINRTSAAAENTGAHCSNLNIRPKTIIPPTANATSWRYESL